MEYNTIRPRLTITEYGRNIQKMIEYTITIEDRNVRSKMARGIILAMGQVNPSQKDAGDFKHKLWDHLFVMSDFKLDVDSPYPMPTPEVLKLKSKPLEYPNKKILFRHYGKNIEIIIKQAMTLEDCPERENLVKNIANNLKKSYLTWNRDTVSDEVIAEHLEMMSEGKLKLGENIRLSSTSDILFKNRIIPKKKPTNNNNRRNNNNHNNRNRRNNNSR